MVCVKIFVFLNNKKSTANYSLLTVIPSSNYKLDALSYQKKKYIEI